MSEWVAWHTGYEPGSPLSRRLAIVRGLISSALDACPPGPIRIISMCAGDGRDLLGVLPGHPRQADVSARLVELDPELAQRGRERASELAPQVEVVTGDAANTSAYADRVPADIVLVCGVFGNITDDDVRHTIDQLATLCAPDATVIWTRGTFEPDLTPTIRVWFMEAGFAEMDFTTAQGTTVGVGANRLTAAPRAFVPDVRLFSFLARADRPSQNSNAR